MRGYNMPGKNWQYRVTRKFQEINRRDFNDLNIVTGKKEFLKCMSEGVRQQYVNKWVSDVNKEEGKTKKGKNKLRTYKLFKRNFCTETYVSMVLPKRDRSALAQFRCGVAPIRLETGRYEGLPEKDRVCPFCPNTVENELHVILECSMYNDLREVLFHDFSTVVPGCLALSKQDMLSLILGCGNEHLIRLTAKTCNDILSRRRTQMYS
jgi:hypothetical protein